MATFHVDWGCGDAKYTMPSAILFGRPGSIIHIISLSDWGAFTRVLAGHGYILKLSLAIINKPPPFFAVGCRCLWKNVYPGKLLV